MMQAPAVVHWGKGIPPDKLAYINDREEALIRNARTFKGKRDVGGIPAYPDVADTAAGDDKDWMGGGGGAANGYGGPGSGSSGGVHDGGGIASGGFGPGAMGSLGGAPAAPMPGLSAPPVPAPASIPAPGVTYPARGDYQGAVPSAAADIMAAARTLTPGVGATPAQRQQYDRWRAEIGQRAINGFPDPAPEKTDREISIPTPGPAAIAPLGAQPGLSAPPATPAVASTSSAPAGPPEGLLGPRSMSYGTQTSNFDVLVQSIANTAAMTQPKIVDRIAPAKSGFGQSYATKRAAPQIATDPRVAQTPVGSLPAGPADIPSPSAQSATSTYWGGRPTAQLTALNPGLLDAPSTPASLAPQMSNIGAKTSPPVTEMAKNGEWTPPNSGPYDATTVAADQDVAMTATPETLPSGTQTAWGRQRSKMNPFASFASAGLPAGYEQSYFPNGIEVPGTAEDVPPEQQIAANPSATSTPWGGYEEPVVGDTTVADTQPPPDGLLEGPRMGDVTPPPNDYFDTARPPATRMAFAARGDGGGVRQEALDNQKKALGGKKGGKKDDKPDDGTDTPGKGSRSRWNLPDWYWQWYRTAGQFGAPRGLLG